MTTQQIISDVAAWLRNGAAARFTFKRATAFNEQQAEHYHFDAVHPAVYEMSMPHDAAEWTHEAQPPHIVAPAIIVTAEGGATHDTQAHRFTLPITLHLQCWNPGTLTTSPDGQKAFTPTADGWKDAVTLADAIRADLANALTIAGCSVAGEISVQYPEMDAFNPADIYWRAAVSFTLTRPVFDKKNTNNLL